MNIPKTHLCLAEEVKLDTNNSTNRHDTVGLYSKEISQSLLTKIEMTGFRTPIDEDYQLMLVSHLILWLPTGVEQLYNISMITFTSPTILKTEQYQQVDN